MVKKYVLEIGDEIVDVDDITTLVHKNNMVCDIVTAYKNKITYYYRQKTWDKYKKYTNEYENIFSTPNTGVNISAYNPLSRAFFKLWEILCDFPEIFLSQTMKCVFLCESPGSFIQATMKYRYDRGFLHDEYHGISLNSNNDKNIPEWKLNGFVNRVTIHYGKDGTGNLYALDNILDLVETIGRNTQDFCTGDGGFDFSSDFNAQELLSLRLIVCEVLTALLLQKEGGSFVLKIYDTFNESTIKILQILKQFYAKIYVIKPLTSRPANSEKYLLCTGFRVSDTNIYEKKITFLKILVRNYESVDLNKVFRRIEYNTSFYHHMLTYSMYYSIKQIYYIQITIDYINNSQKKLVNCENDEKSKKWCVKYHIAMH